MAESGLGEVQVDCLQRSQEFSLQRREGERRGRRVGGREEGSGREGGGGGRERRDQKRSERRMEIQSKGYANLLSHRSGIPSRVSKSRPYPSLRKLG